MGADGAGTTRVGRAMSAGNHGTRTSAVYGRARMRKRGPYGETCSLANARAAAISSALGRPRFHSRNLPRQT